MSAWGHKILGDLCSLITDGKHGDCRSEDDSGYYFISCKDVKDGQINYENARQIAHDDFDETHHRTNLKPGDVLLTNSGTIGRLAVAPDDERTLRTTFQKSVAILKPSPDKITSHFLYYSLAADQAGLVNSAGGAAQKNLLLGELRRFSIKVPSLSVQNEITSILSTYDDLIENNRRRMALLEESARLLYQEWFVRLRFPGHEHTRIINGVPKGWNLRRLDEIAVLNRENLKGSFDGEIDYVDISSVTPGLINEKASYAFRDAPSRARRVVRHGDVIWSCVRPNRRSYAVIWQPPPTLIVSTGFAVITPLLVPTSFLYQAVTTDQFVGYLENHARGAAYPAVVAGDFERARILTPPKVVLSLFDDIASPLLTQSNNLSQQNDKLRTARDLLLPKLMSGEISV